MNKEEALVDFLKGLRIVLNNAANYSKEHPFFKKSVENFKLKVDGLFLFLDSIKLNINPDFIILDGKQWLNQAIYLELAQYFHLRKISSLEIKKGISVDELVDFFGVVTLPRKELLRGGGVKNLLPRKIPSITVEELDYSKLLGEGSPELDVWLYILRNSTRGEGNPDEISKIAGNFGKNLGRIDLKELLYDGELSQSVSKYLSLLRKYDFGLFKKCIKEMFEVVARSKKSFNEEDLRKLEVLFKNLDEKDYSQLFFEEISTNDNFDILSFNLFSQLSGVGKKGNVSEEFLKSAKEFSLGKESAKLSKKIKELLTNSDSQNKLISEVYQSTLSQLFKSMDAKEELFFDRAALKINYRFVIANLAAIEKNKVYLDLIFEKLYKEISEAYEQKDFEFILYLHELCKRQERGNSPAGELFGKLEEHIYKIIEDVIWDNEEIYSIILPIIESMPKSRFQADEYVSKIFQDNKVSFIILKLYFKFFPDKVNLFCDNLKGRISDIEFISKVIEGLRKVDTAESLIALKQMYSFSNEFIRIEILKAMQNLYNIDEGFLFEILNLKDLFLKREAFLALVKNGASRDKVIKEMLLIKSPFGLKNNLIIDNLCIFEGAQVKEAKDYIEMLAKRKFFWNKLLREKARSILARWQVG
ncbi:MAG: hypothetical protein PHO70_05250 [Candidatus Omnitrophica bacterium]|nr:hypothetical protein [Candidatus Omnitrophota bacterium]